MPGGSASFQRVLTNWAYTMNVLRANSAPRVPQVRSLVDPEGPTPKLDRPVLVIPGGTARRHGLPATLHYLTYGGNNVFGGSFRADQRTQFEQSYQTYGGDVFALEYTRAFGSLKENAKEIQAAIEDIQRLTGAQEVDVVAECKGALETRTYLQESNGNDGIRNFVAIAPPNRGMVGAGDLAFLWSKAVNTFHLPVDSLGNEVNVEGAGVVPAIPIKEPGVTHNLGAFNTDFSLGGWHWNPQLADLNQPENRAKQRAAVNSFTVISGQDRSFDPAGGGGIPLPFPALRGDTMVPKWSSFSPDAENFYYGGKRAAHGRVHSHPEGLAKIVETLVSDGHPEKDEAFVEKVPSPAKAIGRIGLWTASAGSRAYLLAGAMAGGATPGPVGLALGSIAIVQSVVDGADQLKEGALKGKRPLKNTVGALAKFAQGAGVILALRGSGWPAAALIGGGAVASAWSWT